MTYQPFRPSPRPAEPAPAGPAPDRREMPRAPVATLRHCDKPAPQVAKSQKSQVANPETALSVVLAGLDRLATAPPLSIAPGNDWSRQLAAARGFAREWDAQARRLGWGDLDLYGLHPVAPSAHRAARGLAWSIGDGERVIALTADAATVETAGGNRLRYFRARGDTGAVLAWRLPITTQRAAQ